MTAQQQLLKDRRQQVQLLQQRLSAQSPLMAVQQAQKDVTEQQRRLNQAMNRLMLIAGKRQHKSLQHSI